MTGLREKRQALMERMLEVEAEGGAGWPPIPRRESDGPVPLSYSQERLWFLDQLAPGSAFYVESAALRLTMAIKPEAMERAINAVIARHEVLRTRFNVEGGRPLQTALPALHLPLPCTDLSALPASEQEQEVERIAVEHATRPFD